MIKTTYGRPKLFETNDNQIIKVFYPRNKKLSSNTYQPYALRFCHNAKKLKKLGLEAPVINNIMHCDELDTYVVTYEKLEGIDTRHAVKNNVAIVHDIALFIAKLHREGVFFRSIHLENIVYQPNGCFALVDIVDIRFKKSALSFYLRLRNLKHFFFIKDDRLFWKNYGIESFLESYFSHANLSSFSKKMLRMLLLFLQRKKCKAD